MLRPCLLLVAALCLGATAHAQYAAREPAGTLSDLTFVEAVGLTGLRLLAEDPVKRETGRRLTDALALTLATSTLLKEVTHEARPAPYQAEDDAFPSGHAAVSFAVAAALSAREVRATWIAYPLAAANSWSRLSLHKHTWAQVLAGAALGTFLGRQAGQGKLRLLGHKDQEWTGSLQAAGDAPTGRVGPPQQISLWGTSF